MNDNPESVFGAAYAVANGLLMMSNPVTEEDIDRAVDTVAAMPQFVDLDKIRLKKELETANNVQVGGFSVLSDREYQAWLSARKEQTEFRFWKRYREFLKIEKRIPLKVIDELDNLTDEILDHLRDPATPGSWDRRGLVVGDVQSGKTSNYTGLICKAVDAGFRLVIVLAGVHNSLRSQTQFRLDEGFLGFDTRLHLKYDQANQLMGAGRLPGAPLLIVHSLTSSSDTGDFRKKSAEGHQIIPGGKDPLLLVVKKNVSVLRNLLSWALSVQAQNDESTPLGKIIRNIPLLLIDDEADHASVNTNEYMDEDGKIIEDNDPTRTNELIRKLLSAFDQSCYVGYTATPFANVFIHHLGRADKVGEDLFPRSFIVNLPPPSNYIGPDRVFGLDREGAEETDQGLPIVRPVTDAVEIFPPRHNKTLDVGILPESLRGALRSFILSSAARRARGDRERHNSMLIHVTRFNAVQEQVARLVDEELADMRRQLEYPGTGGNLSSELRSIWNSDYIQTSEMVRERLTDHDLAELTWDAVAEELFPAVRRMEVKQINGSAKDALDYVDHPHGLSVIAVGGDKLSRGLTLEGLTVSYFARTSRMYDTLMQMGRWFGYRPRYADLCRLYTPPELITWYRHIATASAELREEFDQMFNRGLTPLDFGNRVRTHPDGLLITAANKMRAATKIRAGFSGTISETVAFDLEKKADTNFEVFDSFFNSLGEPGEPEERKFAWPDIPGEQIRDLMSQISTSADSWKANSQALAKYIDDRLTDDQLRSWTVVLVGGGSSGVTRTIGGRSVTLTRREQKGHLSHRYNIGRLISPPDEKIDLDETQRELAYQETLETWKKKGGQGKPPRIPSGPAIRGVRQRENGLLLVYPVHAKGTRLEVPLMGFALSFPYDEDARLVEYAEGSVRKLEEEFE